MPEPDRVHARTRGELKGFTHEADPEVSDDAMVELMDWDTPLAIKNTEEGCQFDDVQLK